MWIKYKCKGGETAEDVAKLHKIKPADFERVLQIPENRKALQFHKKKASFPKGLVVTVPDTKAKIYKFRGPKGDMFLTEKEWKDAQASLNKTMNDAYRKLYMAWDVAETIYQGQKGVNKQHPVISFMCSTWVGSHGREPIEPRNASNRALNKLHGIIKKNDYKNFEKALREAEKAVNLYRTKAVEWQDKLLGSSSNWISGLTITRDASFVIFGAAAMTVAAPVGTAAVLVTGAKVGAGVAFMKSGANEFGRVIAGEDVTITGAGAKIVEDMFWGAVAGAAGAGFAKWVGGYVAPKLAARLVSSPVAMRASTLMVAGTVKSPVARALLGKFQEKALGKMIDEAVKASGRNIAKGTIAVTTKEINQIVATNIGRFIVRNGSGGMVAYAKGKLLSGGDKSAAVTVTKKKAMTSKKKVDEAGLADLIMKDLEKNPVVYEIYDEVLKANQTKIEKAILADVRDLIEAKIKAAR